MLPKRKALEVSKFAFISERVEMFIQQWFTVSKFVWKGKSRCISGGSVHMG
jgi:hypothetical protein